MIKKFPHKGKKIEDNIHTLLVDGNALFKTAYHGGKNEYNHRGEHIGGVYQFITILRKLLNERFYHKVFVFWDGMYSGRLRFEIYRDYKGDRGKNFITGTIPLDKDQIKERIIIQEYLEELYIKQLEDDIVESDDFIAFYCNTKPDNEIITICTNDSDLCQLINDDVKVYLCNKKVYVDPSNYQSVFKHHISNALVVKAISGDDSDSIKGIKGVKEDTLIKHFPEILEKKTSIEEIIKKAEIIQEERVKVKKPRLLALDNIINCVTDGIQGHKMYEINTKLINLKEPFITEEAVEELSFLIKNKLSDDRSIKNLLVLMKRDGMDVRIGNNYESYFLPFKELMEREKKFIYD